MSRSLNCGKSSLGYVGSAARRIVVFAARSAGDRAANQFSLIGAIFLDPLMAEACRPRWRRPGPFRTARARRPPDRLSVNDAFFQLNKQQLLRPYCVGRRLRGASQATNGTRAAHTVSKPSAIPVAVTYGRIVFTPFRLGQDDDDDGGAVMTL
jgi:hypothetical protein